MEELGGLWLQVSKAGKRYMSGTVGDHRVVIFKNEHKKEGERTPDYRVYKSEPKEGPRPPIDDELDDSIPF